MGSQNCLFGGRWEPLRYRFIQCRTFSMGSENDGPWKKHFNSQHVYVGCPAVNFPDRNMETWKRSFPLNITIRLRLLKVELCAKTLWYHDIYGFVFGLLFHPFFCQEIHHHPIGNEHISPEGKNILKRPLKQNILITWKVPFKNWYFWIWLKLLLTIDKSYHGWSTNLISLTYAPRNQGLIRPY